MSQKKSKEDPPAPTSAAPATEASPVATPAAEASPAATPAAAPTPEATPAAAGNATAPTGNVTAPAGNITAPAGNATATDAVNPGNDHAPQDHSTNKKVKTPKEIRKEVVKEVFDHGANSVNPPLKKKPEIQKKE